MRTDRLARAYRLAVTWVHFPLHPDTPERGLTLEALFAGRRVDLPRMQRDMRRRMEAEGLPFARRTHTYNSRLAQELAAWAVTLPGGDAVHDALFRAYFADGINLAGHQDLVRIAGSVGLPADEARRVLEGRTYRARVDADWARAAALGVRAVPTFVAGGRAVVGAQPYGVLEELALAAGARPR